MWHAVQWLPGTGYLVLRLLTCHLDLDEQRIINESVFWYFLSPPAPPFLVVLGIKLRASHSTTWAMLQCVFNCVFRFCPGDSECNPLTFASWVVGTPCMCHHTQPFLIFFISDRDLVLAILPIVSIPRMLPSCLVNTCWNNWWMNACSPLGGYHWLCYVKDLPRLTAANGGTGFSVFLLSDYTCWKLSHVMG
jgi:hypothetical protein